MGEKNKLNIIVIIVVISLFVVNQFAESGNQDFEVKLLDNAGLSAFELQNASGTAFVRMGSDGKVGIGLTNPSSTLHVVGSVTASQYFGDGSNLTGIVKTVTSSSIVDNTIQGEDLSSSISFVTVGSITTRAELAAGMISSTGQVSGQDFTIISGKFVVDDTGSLTASVINADSITSKGELRAANGLFLVDSNGSVTAMSLSVAGNTLFVEDSKVGLGTLSPDERLHVNGAVKFAGSTFGSSTGTLYYNTDGDGTFRYFDDNGLEIVFGTGTISYVGTLWNQSGGNVYRDTGNVGVGTSTPYYALHVIGTATASSGIVVPAVISDGMIKGGNFTLDSGNFVVTNGGSLTTNNIFTNSVEQILLNQLIL